MLDFGKQIGAAAVILLDEGVSGVTVVKMYDGKIRYMPTSEAIAQRFVGLETVSFYEQMDVCFGRYRQPYVAQLEEVHGAVERLYS